MLAKIQTEPSKHAVAFKDLRSVDQYMMIRFNDVVKTIEEAYENYEFSTIYQTVMNFCTVDLSQFYLDFAKTLCISNMKITTNAVQCKQ